MTTTTTETAARSKPRVSGPPQDGVSPVHARAALSAGWRLRPPRNGRSNGRPLTPFLRRSAAHPLPHLTPELSAAPPASDVPDPPGPAPSPAAHRLPSAPSSERGRAAPRLPSEPGWAPLAYLCSPGSPATAPRQPPTPHPQQLRRPGARPPVTAPAAPPRPWAPPLRPPGPALREAGRWGRKGTASNGEGRRGQGSAFNMPPVSRDSPPSRQPVFSCSVISDSEGSKNTATGILPCIPTCSQELGISRKKNIRGLRNTHIAAMKFGPINLTPASL